MKPSRALALRREALVELGSDDMRHVAGASHVPTCTWEDVTHVSIDVRCPSPSNPLLACASWVQTGCCELLTNGC